MLYFKNQKRNLNYNYDPFFPPSLKSLGNDIKLKIEWKKLTDFKNIILFDGFDTCEPIQGKLGNCYLVAFFISLTKFQNIIQNIFISKYLDNFIYFKVYIDNKIHEIFIDDYIPCIRDSNNELKPAFCQLINNECWMIVLEKVWAKIMGSYSNTISGWPYEVSQVFLSCKYKIYKNPSFNNLKQKNTFICCTTNDCHDVVENGFERFHVYSLLYSEKDYIVLKNPWTNLLKIINWNDFQNNFCQTEVFFIE